MKLSTKIIILVIIIALAFSLYLVTKKTELVTLCKGNKKCFTGTMKEIIDGDTFRVDGKKVRLALVDTPESGIGYREAKTFVEKICPAGSKVLVDQDDFQPYSYDRIIAVVYCNEKNLNAELLQNNLAVMDKRFCSKSEFGGEEWAKDYC